MEGRAGPLTPALLQNQTIALIWERRLIMLKMFHHQLLTVLLVLISLLLSTSTARAISVIEYPIPTPNSGTFGIVLGPDGNIWFAENAADKIGYITPQGVIKEFPLTVGSKPGGGSSPEEMEISGSLKARPPESVASLLQASLRNSLYLTRRVFQVCLHTVRITTSGLRSIAPSEA